MPICLAPNLQRMPAIYENKVVWEDIRNGNWDIYMYVLAFPSSFQKSVNKNSAFVGERLRYTLTCKNTEVEPLKNITIIDEIPPDTEYVEGSATGNPTYDSQNKKLVWTISSLDSGSQISLSYEVKATKEGTVSNEATLIYSGASLKSNQVSTIIKAPKLVLIKSVDKTNASKGDELTYKITYRNDDTSTFQNIVISDFISQNSEYIGGSGSGNPTYDSSSRTLSWQIASLDASSQGEVSFKVKVLGGEKITNKAILTYQEYSLESNETTTTIAVPTANFIEDIAFSFDAGLFQGIYLEEGISITNFGLKGAEAAVGAITGKGLDFLISHSGNNYSLNISQRNSTGAKIEGGLGKIESGPISATALQQGMTATALNGYNYLFSNPLNDANQSANALELALASASSYGYVVFPGVGSFVDALVAYFSPLSQYCQDTTGGFSYQGKIGFLSISLGSESSPKAQISNDVAGVYVSGKVERLTLLNPTDWISQDTFEIASGGNLGVPFIFGKSGQFSFALGYRFNNIQNPSSYFYRATVDEGTNVGLDQFHTINEYEVNCAADLCNRVSQLIQDNAVDAIVSRGVASIQPQRIINDVVSFEELLSKNASEGEAVYTRSIEETIQLFLGFQIDIGASIGVGGGIRIGINGQALTSTSYPTEQGQLINGGRVVTQKFNRVQSAYRGAGGIANFFTQMVNRVLANGDFLNSLKNAFQSVIQEIQEGVDNAVDYVEGGVNWVVSGVTGFLSASRGAPQAELVCYELKTPILLSTSRGYSIGFVPYRHKKVVVLSRQPTQEFTGMRYAVNLNVRKGDGSYVPSFPQNSNTLNITVKDDQLRERGFEPSKDWQNLAIFWFNPEENTWFQLETNKKRQGDSTILSAKPEKPGTYAGGIASLPPDREAPKITILSPQNGAKTSLTPIFSASIYDENLKESTVKFSLDGSEIQPVYFYADQGIRQFLALPSQPLSQGPHKLSVHAEDDSQNKSDISVDFIASPPQPQNLISFISLPFAPADSLNGLVEFEQTAFWNGTNYSLGSDLTIQPTQAFWLKTSQVFSPSQLKLIGYTMSANQEIPISLKKGWNAIGLPWNYQLPLSGLQLEKDGNKIPFSQAGNLIGQILFRWDGSKYINAGLQQGMENILYPWFGYWIRVKEDCYLIFPKEPWNVKGGMNSSDNGFCLPIKAVFPDEVGENVYIGIGRQEITSPFPPPAPYQGAQRRISLLRNNEPLFIDIRREGGKQEWRLWVKGDAVLLFPNLSLVPKGWQIILKDGEKRYYLKTTSAVKVEGEKVLAIEMGEGIVQPLMVSLLDARASGGGVNIVWNVNLDCQVKLVVKAPDGRLIRDFGLRSSSAGGNSIFWDGKTEDGRILPSGIYVVELTARDDMNQMVKAIKGVILR